MTCRRMIAVCSTLLMSASLSAQQASASPTPPTLPNAAEAPADIYQRAMQPVEIVRRSPNNITDSEMAAWGVAVVTAAHACADHKVADYTGENLFHFARLCLLGQQYEDAYVAARDYVKAGNTQSEESARGLMLRASLSAGNLLRAENTANELLRTHPYDGTVHTLVQETIMALSAVDGIENALRFVARRETSLMKALREGSGLQLHEGTYRVPQSTLVRDALSAVYFYRVENRVEGVQAAAGALIEEVRQIVAETSPAVSPLDRDAIQAALHRAELLKAMAPALTIEAASVIKPAKPITEVSYDNKITVLAFYAPWSPQRGPMFDLLANIAHDYRTFPIQILAVSTPGVASGDVAAKPADILAKLLEPFGKNSAPVTVAVAADTANRDFAVDDWPMFAVIDTQGKVRFLDTLGAPEYKDGGRMHRLVAALASQVGPLPTPTTVKGKSGRIKVPEGTLQQRPK